MQPIPDDSSSDKEKVDNKKHTSKQILVIVSPDASPDLVSL